MVSLKKMKETIEATKIPEVKELLSEAVHFYEVSNKWLIAGFSALGILVLWILLIK